VIKNRSKGFASEAQREYARGVGLEIPPDATLDEASDILTGYEIKGAPATAELRLLAETWGVPHTPFTCHEDLCERITRSLVETDRPSDLAAWFAFNVYQDIAGATGSPATGSPADPIIQDIARQLAADQAAMRSIRRKDQRTFRRFGDWTDDVGEQWQGGSRDTQAYKAAAALIRAHLGQVAQPRRASPRPADAPKAENASGCASVVAGIAVALATVAGATYRIFMA